MHGLSASDWLCSCSYHSLSLFLFLLLQSTESSNKQSTVLPSLSTKPKINLTALDHTDPRDSWQQGCSKENTEADKSVHSQRSRERRALKQLQPTEHLPPLSVTEDDSCFDCNGSGVG